MDKADKKNWVEGYKIFSEESYWKNNRDIEIGKIYTYPLTEKNGGFHFCRNMEDTFVFFEYNKGADLYQVCGMGKIINYENDYYGIYDVYASSILKIVRKINREEIVSYFYNFNPTIISDRLLRFIQLFPLTDEEILLFKEKFKRLNKVIRYINYYQEGEDKVFIKKRKL